MSTTNISCPHCLATNRIPTERLVDSPKCGKCKNELFSGKSQELTAGNANAVLTRNEIPVIVDCWASWCGPCQNFAPIFEQVTQKLEPQFRFAKLDTEQQADLAGQWQIRSIPTLILFKHGKEIARISGALSASQFEQWLTENS